MKGINAVNKQRNFIKKSRSIVIAFFIGIGIIGLTLLGLDTFTYWNTTIISNKTEMFQFVIDNQEELDQVVCEMVNQYGTSDDKVVILYKNDWELRSLYNVNELFKKVSARRISIYYVDEIKQIEISFAYVPKRYDYWGIYYSGTGEAVDWGGETNLFEENGIYVQLGSYYKYETEKIVGNWFYYQCVTR